MKRDLEYLNLINILREIDLEKNNIRDIREVLNFVVGKLEKYINENETFLYSYEELQDKIINLQKENKHLKDLYNQALKDYDELVVIYNDKSTRTFDTLTIDVLDYITNLQKENNKLNNIIIKTIDYLEDSQKSLEEWHFDGYDPRLDIIINELKENKQ